MIILGGLNIKLWFIWGLLTFAFNFIPNVGSLIAMILPVPVRFSVAQSLHRSKTLISLVEQVILVDAQLGVAKQVAAILLPALVQGCLLRTLL